MIFYLYWLVVFILSECMEFRRFVGILQFEDLLVVLSLSLDVSLAFLQVFSFSYAHYVQVKLRSIH